MTLLLPRLVFFCLGDIHPQEIDVIAVSSIHIFTACGNTIRSFERGRKVCSSVLNPCQNFDLVDKILPLSIEREKAEVVMMWLAKVFLYQQQIIEEFILICV